MMNDIKPGLIALIGSGETTRHGGLVFERLLGRYSPGCMIAILETPAGFELNSPAVAGRVADYLRKRLKNQLPEIRVLAARAKGSAFSPDDPGVVAPLASADLIFMGPGSPSYAVRQLDGSLAWKMLCEQFWGGASLALASAAVIASSRHALPIYEIYKVGEDPHWLKGLDFFGAVGLELAIIPHWDNHDGGAELDTSHCFMGADRFRQLHGQLPKSATVTGIDEMTSLVIDLADESCEVMGMGQVHLLRGGKRKDYQGGEVFPLSDLGNYNTVAIRALSSSAMGRKPVEKPREVEKGIPVPPEVIDLAAERQAARERKDWAAADRDRVKIESLGWQITDTSEGFRLSKKQV